MGKAAGTGKFRKFLYHDTTVGYIFALPFIFGFICFSLIPMATSLYYSFR